MIERPAIKSGDFTALLSIVLAAPLSLLPQALWCPLASLASKRRSASVERMAHRMEVAGGYSAQTAESLAREHQRLRCLSYLMFVRGLMRTPVYNINIRGEEHIRAALEAGNGAMLWVADFVFAGDVSKFGLSAKGYRASHLSRPEHGFSDTRFGIRFLNPIRTNFELRYLRERVVHQRASPGQAARRLIERLKENGIVSIAATAYEGLRLQELDFFSGRTKLAPGAPAIAFRAGAPLLPVLVLPAPEPPDFQIVVGEPIKPRAENKDAAIACAAADYVAQLEEQVRARPELWRGWSDLEPRCSYTRADDLK